jgi:hypothetical protein
MMQHETLLAALLPYPWLPADIQRFHFGLRIAAIGAVC